MDTANNQEEIFWQLLAKKLAANATEQERNELEQILFRFPEWRMYDDLLSQMWQQENIKPGVLNADAAYVKHLLTFKDELVLNESAEIRNNASNNDLYKKKSSAFFKKYFYKALASTMVASSVLFYFIFWADENKNAKIALPQTSSISTKNGNRSKITLPDGTQVWLNSGSKIDYSNLAFNTTLREVTLTGEAFFDVTKNPEKPFIVHTSGIAIKVLGTAFNVKSYTADKTVETSLLRGLVEITRNGDSSEQPIFLHPNEKIIIAKTNGLLPNKLPEIKNANRQMPQIVFKITHLDSSQNKEQPIETAWINNRLVFHNESFAALAPKLERWYNVSVVFEDEKTKQLNFYGSFENETLDQAFTALTSAAKFHFRIVNNQVFVSSLK